MKIIDNNDNEFICRVGSPLTGVKIKKIYVWHEELENLDWDDYVTLLEPKFIDGVNIKVNRRYKADKNIVFVKKS